MLLKSYLKSIIRDFVRRPLVMTIQLFALIMVITSFLAMLLWSCHQLSFDKFVEKKDRIYRLEFSGSDYEGFAGQTTMTSVYLKNSIPEIENFVRFRKMGKDEIWQLSYETESASKTISGQTMLVDSSFFNVFSYPLIMGDMETALDSPNSIVLSDKVAKSLFGNENPIGKTLYDSQPLTVTGIYKHRNNFHIKFDWFRSLLSQKRQFAEEYNIPLNNWRFHTHPTYLLLKEGTKAEHLEEKINRLMHQLDHVNDHITFYLRPLEDIYFNGATRDEAYYAVHGNKKLVIAIFLLGISLLIVGSLNFIKLFTARASDKTREFVVRKVIGSKRMEHLLQFLTETFALYFLALIASITIIELILPHFNHLTKSDLDLSLLQSWLFWLLAIACILLISIATALIQTYYFDHLRLDQLLRNIPPDTPREFVFRRLFIVMQFIVASFLVFATLTVHRQLHYMDHKEPGFQYKNRFVMGFNGKNLHGYLKPLKETITSHPDIISVSHCFGVPGEMLPYGYSLDFNGSPLNFRRILIDTSYFRTLGIQLVDGRNFDLADSLDVVTDAYQKYARRIIINETAARELSLGEKTIGSIGYIQGKDIEIEIIGIVKDFHFNSFKDKIPPIYFLNSDGSECLSLIIHSDHEEITGLEKNINECINQVLGEDASEFQLGEGGLRPVEDKFKQPIEDQRRLRTLLLLLTLIATFIACHGLYALSAYNQLRRRREVAVRKAYGALVPNIMVLMTKEYLIYIGIALLISQSVSYWVMNKWLMNYAYHVNMNFSLFLTASVITTYIAFITVFYQTFKTALARPSYDLKYE